MVRQALGLDDPTLIGAMSAFLYLAVPRAMRHVIGDLMPEKKRMRRTILLRVKKARNLKHIPGYSRGTLVSGPDPDLGRPPINRALLAEWLAPATTDTQLMVPILGEHLIPAGDHGGYCYLQDLVDWLEQRSKSLRDPPLDGERPDLQVLDRLHAEETMQACREILIRELDSLGRRTVKLDRPEDPGLDPATRQRWLEILTVYLCQALGLADPRWDGCSIRKIALTLIPGLTREEYRLGHQWQIERLLRIVRDRMSANRWSVYRGR